MNKDELHSELDKVIDITDLPVDGFIFYVVKRDSTYGSIALNLPQLINILSVIIKHASQSLGVSDVNILSGVCNKLK